MKRIIFSLMTLVAVLTVSGAGSFAYFSDTETSQGNTFTAGTLDLKVLDALGETWLDDPVPAVISAGYLDSESEIGNIINNMKPGDKGFIIVPIKNDGSVDGVAQLQLTNLVDYENGVNDPECEAEGGIWDGTTCSNCATGCGDLEGELSQNMKVVIKYGEGPYALITSGKLYDLADDLIELGDLAAGEEKGVKMVFSIKDTVGNIIQSDSVEFDIIFHLEQAP